jgi:WD40 repeat protein
LPPTPAGASSVAFSPNQKFLVTTHRDQLKQGRVWELETGNELGKLLGAIDIFSAVFSPDGKTIVTAGRRKLSFWDVPDPFPKKLPSWYSRAALTTHQNWTRDLSFSRDGRLLAAADEANDTTVWEVATKTPQRRLPGGGGVLSPDGALVAAVDASKSPNQPAFWDAATGAQRPPAWGAHSGRIACMTFSADGKRLITASRDGTVKVWDPTTSQECWTRQD